MPKAGLGREPFACYSRFVAGEPRGAFLITTLFLAGDQLFEFGHEPEHGRVFAGQALQVADHGARIVLVAGFLEGDGGAA